MGGTAAVGATYIDRPTVIYAPLTGNDFIKKLMSPLPPSAVLFLLQSGYSALVVMPLTVESINGLIQVYSKWGKLDESIDASPVALGKQLYLRGPKHLYCIEAR